MSLPESAVKELLSRGFLRLVANQAGFIICTDELDFGVDLGLRHVEFFERNGGLAYRRSSFAIDLQLKATCDAGVTFEGEVLKYDLDVTTYNDLVRRAREVHTIPMVLLLFVLPDDRLDWLSFAASHLMLKRCAYIWRPGTADEPSGNAATKRISISVANRVDASTFESLRREYLS